MTQSARTKHKNKLQIASITISKNNCGELLLAKASCIWDGCGNAKLIVVHNVVISCSGSWRKWQCGVPVAPPRPGRSTAPCWAAAKEVAKPQGGQQVLYPFDAKGIFSWAFIIGSTDDENFDDSNLLSNTSISIATVPPLPCQQCIHNYRYPKNAFFGRG